MATLSKQQLQDVLTNRLKLIAPQFVLEKVGRKWSGNIISATFKGLNDEERQRRLWAALDAEFSAECVHLVGTLLAYTPAEWEVNLVPAGGH